MTDSRTVAGAMLGPDYRFFPYVVNTGAALMAGSEHPGVLLDTLTAELLQLFQKLRVPWVRSFERNRPEGMGKQRVRPNNLLRREFACV